MQTQIEHPPIRARQPITHTIFVVLERGLVREVKNIPPGIEIHVLDYDIEGADQLQVSPLDGEACVITEFTT